jgi:NADPH:quinone reductase-like Zn-dependent oxidoreductase
MKAAVYSAYGSPDVLSIAEVATPVPGEGEVLVRVSATSVNDYDWHLLTGRPLLNRASGLMRPRYPVLGSDVAGRVEALGAGVTGVEVGDEVFGDVSPHGFGAFAEYVTAPASAFAPVPAGLTMQQAAAVPQAGGLAVMGLTRTRGVRAGDQVLVNGAGGGTGTFAVQIAKAAGAEVTAVDAQHKLDRLRELGADRVLDYAVDDFTAGGERYHVILDVFAYRSIRTYKRCLRPGGVCAVTGGRLPTVFWILAAGQVASRVGDRHVTVPMWRPNDPGEVAELSRMLEAGAVVPVVDSVFSLDDLAGAFRRFGAQQHVGKIVITC